MMSVAAPRDAVAAPRDAVAAPRDVAADVVAGIDVGSRAIKAVALAADGRVLARERADTPVDHAAGATAALARLARAAGVDAFARVVATGYGRRIVPGAQRQVTEITCHAAGIHRLLPAARTVVEVGGQDSKVVRLGPDGRVADFAMNDRCAAGTGRFLEVVAARLDTPLTGLGALIAAAPAPEPISSMCVVFAESEIVGLLAGGAAPGAVAAGVVEAVASRVAALAGRNLNGPIAFTGGVALVPGMAAALARALGHPILVPDDPQYTGALGAAVLAAR